MNISSSAITNKKYHANICYANIFDTPKYQDKIESIAYKYLSSCFKNNSFIRQQRTQLLSEVKETRPFEATKELLSVISID